MRVVYIGHKDQKGDNVAQTGLIWKPGEIHEVADEKKALKLLEHTGVWANADKPYQMVPELKIIAPGIEPRVEILPTGGEFVSQHWEPLRLTVDKDVFAKLRSEELMALFVTPADAEAFAKWKKAQEEKAAKRDKQAA
jgi:hypothetical protein